MSEAVDKMDKRQSVDEPVSEVPFILRVIWFFVLGWELTAIWILIAWAFNATILGLPIGLWMINRVPQVLTLKARKGVWEVDAAGRRRHREVEQPPFIARALYFLFIGWWFSLIWAAFGWLLCVSIVGLPLGVMMLHWLPRVTTLQRS